MMKGFSNLKIRVKLIVCFITLAFFTAIVGVIGIGNMNAINKRADEIYKTNFIPATLLSQVQRNMIYIRSDLFLLAYEKDPLKVNERINRIKKYADENNDWLKSYELTLVNTTENKDEEALYKKLSEIDIPDYRVIREEVISLFGAEKNDEAIAKISELTVAREKVENGLNDLIELNKKYAEEANKKNALAFKSQTTLMLFISVFGVVVAVLLGLIVANIICVPIYRLIAGADKIAEGDLDVIINVEASDEIGVLSQAFKKMAENVNGVMSSINLAAEQVASGANQVSSSSMALSQGATEQASSIEELTASLEEIAEQTKMNAKNANEASNIAKEAKDNALQGNHQMQGMLRAMEEINNSSSNISKIIKVIDEIAFQTNILALNAAVEAARAGQHGKGFAVVAEEVRNLAARSANAAKETTDMIEGSIKKVEGGTKIANETANALNEIVGAVTKVADLVGNIAVASNEQAAGITQINEGIMQVSEVVQTNSATSQESAAASEELSSQAQMLKQQVAKFRLRRDKYASSHYQEIEEINPEVLKRLDHMNQHKTNLATAENYQESSQKRKIKKDLSSDKEFGKY